MKKTTTRKSWKRQLLITTTSVALMALLMTGITPAQDKVIINGSSCQAIEEDANLDFCAECTGPRSSMGG